MFVGDGVYTVFDTGASNIYLSEIWHDTFIKKLFSHVGVSYQTRGGRTYATCEADYPNLYFMMDGYWL